MIKVSRQRDCVRYWIYGVIKSRAKDYLFPSRFRFIKYFPWYGGLGNEYHTRCSYPLPLIRLLFNFIVRLLHNLINKGGVELVWNFIIIFLLPLLLLLRNYYFSICRNHNCLFVFFFFLLLVFVVVVFLSWNILTFLCLFYLLFFHFFDDLPIGFRWWL